MKRFLAATRIGQTLLTTANHLGLHKDAMLKPEVVGMRASDIITARLRDGLCLDGKIFVDVGCHIGSVIGGVRQHAKPSKIIAVEAIPEKVVSLRKHFPGVEFHECAVGETDGEVEFTIDTAQSGYSSLDPAVKQRASSYKIIKVKLTTLDAILPHEGVDVMKIDVEGAELGALRGAEAVIAGSRPTIVFESGPSVMAGYPKEALFKWFGDHGYDVVLPIRVAHNAPPLTLETFMDAHEYPRRSTDFFGIPRERRTEVRDRARKILGISA